MMSKVFVFMVLNTTNKEGDNQVLQAQIDVQVSEDLDAAISVANDIRAAASDGTQFVSFPVNLGSVSVRGSAIEWFQTINVPEDAKGEDQINELESILGGKFRESME